MLLIFLNTVSILVCWIPLTYFGVNIISEDITLPINPLMKSIAT